MSKNEISKNTKSETMPKIKKKFSYNPNEGLDEMDYGNFNNLNQYNSLLGNSMFNQQLNSGINGGVNPFDQMNSMYGYNSLPNNMDLMRSMGGFMGGMNQIDQANNFAPLQNGLSSNFKSFNLKSKKRDGKKRFDLRVLDSLNDY